MTTVRPGVWYTLEEVAQFRDNPELAGLVLRGYVLTQDPVNGRVKFTHWKHAGMDMGEKGNLFGKPVEKLFDKHELPPRTARTGAQRMDSLMAKVGDDLRHYLSGQAGHIVSAEETRQVAQGVMEEVDKDFEASERKKIARTTGDPYS